MVRVCWCIFQLFWKVILLFCAVSGVAANANPLYVTPAGYTYLTSCRSEYYSKCEGPFVNVRHFFDTVLQDSSLTSDFSGWLYYYLPRDPDDYISVTTPNQWKYHQVEKDTTDDDPLKRLFNRLLEKNYIDDEVIGIFRIYQSDNDIYSAILLKESEGHIYKIDLSGKERELKVILYPNQNETQEIFRHPKSTWYEDQQSVLTIYFDNQELRKKYDVVWGMGFNEFDQAFTRQRFILKKPDLFFEHSDWFTTNWEASYSNGIKTETSWYPTHHEQYYIYTDATDSVLRIVKTESSKGQEFSLQKIYQYSAEGHLLVIKPRDRQFVSATRPLPGNNEDWYRWTSIEKELAATASPVISEFFSSVGYSSPWRAVFQKSFKNGDTWSDLSGNIYEYINLDDSLLRGDASDRWSFSKIDLIWKPAWAILEYNSSGLLAKSYIYNALGEETIYIEHPPPLPKKTVLSKNTALPAAIPAPPEKTVSWKFVVESISLILFLLLIQQFPLSKIVL